MPAVARDDDSFRFIIPNHSAQIPLDHVANYGRRNYFCDTPRSSIAAVPPVRALSKVPFAPLHSRCVPMVILPRILQMPGAALVLAIPILMVRLWAALVPFYWFA